MPSACSRRVPAERRVLVTAHDAFNYFGRRYGFEVQGIQGISTESEAGLQRIEELVDLLVERADPRRLRRDDDPRPQRPGADRRRRRRAATRSRSAARCYSDAMGAPGTYEGTYVGMIDHNVTTIARALGGKTPAARA